MIFPHWSLAPWDEERWLHFHPREFACKGNGELYYWPDFFDRIEAVRQTLGRPIRINSGHRSWRHNLAVGGAPKSEHRRLAVDISLAGHDRLDLLTACKAAGFTGFGYYRTFLHVDLGRPRFWFSGDASRDIWLSEQKDRPDD